MRGFRFRTRLSPPTPKNPTSSRRTREKKPLLVPRVVWYWWPTFLTLISFVKGNKPPSPTNKPETEKPATEKPTQKVTSKPTEKTTKTPKPTEPYGGTPSGTKCVENLFVQRQITTDYLSL